MGVVAPGEKKMYSRSRVLIVVVAIYCWISSIDRDVRIVSIVEWNVLGKNV